MNVGSAMAVLVCDERPARFRIEPRGDRAGQLTQEQQTIPQGQTSSPPPQIFVLHANGQSAPRSGGARDVGRGEGSHTPSTASESFSKTGFVFAFIIFIIYLELHVIGEGEFARLPEVLERRCSLPCRPPAFT